MPSPRYRMSDGPVLPSVLGFRPAISSASSIDLSTGLRRRRGQGSHRNIECVHEAGRLVGEPHVAVELLAKGFDQSCPEAGIFGKVDGGTVLLGPCKVQTLGLWVQRPADVNASLRNRQGAKLRGVRVTLVKRYRDGDESIRRYPDIGSGDRESRLGAPLLPKKCSCISAAFRRIVARFIASVRSSPNGIPRASSMAATALASSSLAKDGRVRSVRANELFA
jgi:hypothetical protein